MCTNNITVQMLYRLKPSRVEQTQTNSQQRSAVVVFIQFYSNLVAQKFLSHFKCQAPYKGANYSLVISHIDWTDSSRNNAARAILEKHYSSFLTMKLVLSHHPDHVSESTMSSASKLRSHLLILFLILLNINTL